jgi:ferrochelatase
MVIWKGKKTAPVIQGRYKKRNKYMHNNAVVLFNLGGPDSLEAVEPFLFNLFSDHDIFGIPFGQKLFARMMSRLRGPKVREKYKQIGGRSPINEWTELQRSMLQQEFQEADAEIEVFTAMRYWKPTIEDTAEKISEKSFEKIALLPLYPHYSTTTTGSSFNEWRRVYRGETDRLKYVYEYFDNHKYVAAVNERIDETIRRFPETVRGDIQIVFSAHGIPESLALLVVPVSFVSDHIETLHELDIEYREVADEVNIENFIVMPGLNDSKTFVEALKEIAIQALKP